jgi:hypothetical protein
MKSLLTAFKFAEKTSFVTVFARYRHTNCTSGPHKAVRNAHSASVSPRPPVRRRYRLRESARDWECCGNVRCGRGQHRFSPWSGEIRGDLYSMLSKLETNRGVSGGFAPPLCGKAAPFRPNVFLFLLIRAAGRLCLPAARMRSVGGSYNGKAQPFRTANGEAAGHHSIVGSNFDQLDLYWGGIPPTAALEIVLNPL